MPSPGLPYHGRRKDDDSPPLSTPGEDLRERRTLLGELTKLAKVSGYIAEQYGRVATGSREAREFLTSVYMRAQRTRVALPVVTARELFGDLPHVELRLYDSAEFFTERELTGQVSLMKHDDLRWLATLTQLLRPRRIVEIGTFQGGTTSNFLLNAPPDCEITTIDVQERPLADARVREVFAGPRVHRIIADSATHDFGDWYGTADLVFVDGDHHERGVRADSEQALRLLGPGGTILWHDYCAGFVGVVRVVEELAQRLPIFRLRGSTTAIYRAAA